MNRFILLTACLWICCQIHRNAATATTAGIRGGGRRWGISVPGTHAIIRSSVNCEGHYKQPGDAQK